MGTNILVAVISPLVFLVLAEGILALAGVKTLSLTEDPYFGFAGGQPLFLKKTGADGSEIFETNPVKLSHFNRQSFSAKKTPGTLRIFTLGGSTTYGHPWRDATSFSAWLREYLQEADAGRKIEVVNCGGISYASYRVAKLAEELIRYEPDFFIVYNGHNEFLEERTYRPAMEKSGWIRETSALLDRTRTYTVMRSAIRKFSPQAPAGSSKKNQLTAEVDEVLIHTIGPVSYVRDDSLRLRVLEHYETAQKRVALLGHSIGAKTIFLSTPSNERDCSPFKTESTPGISDMARGQASAYLERGTRLLDSSPDSAFLELTKATALDPRNAAILYQAGKAALAVKKFPESKEFFRRAVDEDICPLRALTPMREIEKRAAEATGSGFVDYLDSVESKSLAEHGNDILGEPDFVDHVHLTVENYGLMARGIFDEMARLGAVHPDANFADSGKARVRRKILARLDSREEGLGLHNIAKVTNWAGKHEDAARVAERALALDTLSLEAIWSSLFVGAALERQGKSAQAVPHYRRAVKLDSNFADARKFLGNALLRIRDTLEAVVQLGAALLRDPGDAESREQLTRLDLIGGRFAQAEEHLRVLAALQPENGMFQGMLGAALVEQGKLDEAEIRFRDAVKQNPNSAGGWLGMGRVAEARGRIPDAIQAYARASQLDPDAGAARMALSRLLGQSP